MMKDQKDTVAVETAVEVTVEAEEANIHAAVAEASHAAVETRADVRIGLINLAKAK